jgi:glucose/arabinose dehydrogenase
MNTRPRRIFDTLALFALAACGHALLPGGWTLNLPGCSADPMPEPPPTSRIRLPPGFSINTFASGIEGARMLRFTPAGDLLVSATRQGKVLLIERDDDGDGRADGQKVLLENLNGPHGMVIHDGWLYVAETDAVLRVRFDPATRRVGGTLERIVRGLPSGGNHVTRTIGIGPDGFLYVSIGSSCNVCIEKDRRRAAIVRYRLDGTDEHIYATGLRNAVGFAWQPGTGALYATDNGRDLLGDDFPPCELDRVVDGGFYGWPFANGIRVPDPDFGKGREELIAKSIPPAHGFGAHTAPLGITFYTGTSFPERYRGAAFVAQHGSWNRSRKSGYKVVVLFFDPQGSIREEDFVSGFEINEQVYGRPVDVAVGPDGALYVSDDFAGSIYRVTYGTDA